jgi:hypothetical protein
MEIMAVGIRHADHVAPSIQNIGTNFIDKWQALGRYISLMTQATEGINGYF